MPHDPPPSTDEMDVEQYVISPAVRRKLQRCYEHGASLMSDEDYDFDYATTMFSECVVQDPANLVYVEAFLENLQRKFKNNKRGGRILGFGGKGPFKRAVARQDWKEALAIGPALLKTNPWDVTVLRGMAQACEALHFNEAELRYLKNALDANPKDAEVNRHCALSLARMGQFDQAIVCWHRVEEVKRHDPEAPKMISTLTVERARARSGFSDEVPSARAAPKPRSTSRQTEGDAVGKGSEPSKHQASSPADQSSSSTQNSADSQDRVDTENKAHTDGGAHTEGGAGTQDMAEPGNGRESADDSTGSPRPSTRRREIVLTPRQKLERAIMGYPEGVENYLQLADLHVQEDRPVDAEKVLTKALAVSGGDVAVREKLEDATAQRMRHQLAIAQQRAEIKQTREARELAEEIGHNLIRYELEVLQSRAQRYPRNESLRLQLGRRLKRLGNFQEAAGLFEQVENDAACRGAAQLELGECLQHLKKYPKALLAYEHAVDAAGQISQIEVQKLSLYRAGVLAGALRQVEAARRHFTSLCDLDPEYKDARDRLDKLNEIGHKE